MRRGGSTSGSVRGLLAVTILVSLGTVLAVARHNVDDKLRKQQEARESGPEATPAGDAGTGWSALDVSEAAKPAGDQADGERGDAGLGKGEALPPPLGGVPGLSNHNSAPDAGIDSGTVGSLEPAWVFRAGGCVSHEPILDAGRLYVADWGGAVHCLDARSGRAVWTRSIARPETDWPWHGFAGTGALGDGMLFEASAEGRIYALDLQDGAVVWQRSFTSNPNAGNAGRLLCHDGMVFVPVQSVEEALAATVPGFEPGFRGSVMALDQRTGDTVWELPLADEGSNGVAVWTGFALDPDSGVLYFATGNNYTGAASELSDSLVAVDCRSGKVLWHRQVTGNDVWTMAQPLGPDADFGGAPQLFEATIDGKVRRLVGAGQKSGVYTVWDRETGRRVWNTSLGFGQVGGGICAEPSISSGWLLLWSNNSFAFKDPEAHPLDVAALDPATGGYIWVKRGAQPAAVRTSGFLAGDVYLVPSLDGRVRAYRAQDGAPLWTSRSHGSVASSVKAADGMVFFGTGVPEAFGGDGGQGSVVAYRLSERSPGWRALATYELDEE